MKLDTYKKAAWQLTSRCPLWKSNISANGDLFPSKTADRMPFVGRQIWTREKFVLRPQDPKSTPTLFKLSQFHFARIENAPGSLPKIVKFSPILLFQLEMGWAQITTDVQQTETTQYFLWNCDWQRFCLYLFCSPSLSATWSLFTVAIRGRLYDSKIFRGLLWSIAD